MLMMMHCGHGICRRSPTISCINLIPSASYTSQDVSIIHLRINKINGRLIFERPWNFHGTPISSGQPLSNPFFLHSAPTTLLPTPAHETTSQASISDQLQRNCARHVRMQYTTPPP
ncbi:hypothetical protein I7I53_12274 [Histoplasma capsulatum var. duboisii H88]|uniref:Uncharacterized protein n=1 Tax=Ajellomyces capsulatus (strain H88) TaxID=544711 RepID=A0A8A1LUY9_AJEC8|nr:hypothetical protein I7I53_12274 [Histoplasma capsulatum var. duboisii H88]